MHNSRYGLFDMSQCAYAIYDCVIIGTLDVEGLGFSSVVHNFLPEKVNENLVKSRDSADKGGQV